MLLLCQNPSVMTVICVTVLTEFGAEFESSRRARWHKTSDLV